MKISILKKLLVPAILLSALFVSCTKSGALTGNSSPSGSYSTLTGTINGGLSGVSGAAVTLMIAGVSSPLASATSASDGSFSLTYSNPGGNSLLYVTSAGGNAGSGTNAKAQFLTIAGTTGSPPSSLRVNEMTTAATETVAFYLGLLNDVNGIVTINTPKSSFVVTNAVTQFNNFVATGSVNASNAHLTSSQQNGLEVLANAFAACIENSANCSTLFNGAVSSTGSPGLSLLESGVNALSNSAADATAMYNVGALAGNNPGFGFPSSPSGLSFTNGFATTTKNVFAFSGESIAADASGNIWFTNGSNLTEMNGTGSIVTTFSAVGASEIAIDASGNLWLTNSNQVSEYTPGGSLVGNFSTGSGALGLAIDASGNVWVCNNSATTVTKLNSSGTSLGSFTVGTAPRGVVIDASGNTWVTNYTAGTISELTSSGAPIRTISSAFTHPAAITIDPSGNLWINSDNTAKTSKLSPVGVITSTFSTSATGFSIMADQTGNLWTILNNTFLTEYLPSGTVAANYTYPGGQSQGRGMALDASGNLWTYTISPTGELAEFSGIASPPAFFPYSGPAYAWNNL